MGNLHELSSHEQKKSQIMVYFSLEQISILHAESAWLTTLCEKADFFFLLRSSVFWLRSVFCLLRSLFPVFPPPPTSIDFASPRGL